ncbi:hypothetical protein GCM10008012_22750 [Rhizobium anhuiense]|jgi:hypothetical protein|nr:hypothetical protein GCM10008012_22750 [Rhizobium anhuiense]
MAAVARCRNAEIPWGAVIVARIYDLFPVPQLCRLRITFRKVVKTRLATAISFATKWSPFQIEHKGGVA